MWDCQPKNMNGMNKDRMKEETREEDEKKSKTGEEENKRG